MEQDGQPDADISKEFRAMTEAGMGHEISMVSHPPYAADDGRCIRIENQGQFRPIHYCYGLANAILRAGGAIYTNSKVAEWKAEKSGEDPCVKTSSGHTVKCKNIVMATNVPLQMITTIGKLEANRTYVVAGEVPKGKYEWCIFQDDSMIHREPYMYGRFVSSSDTSDMLLIGGEDNKVGFAADPEEKFQNIEQWARERYPDIRFTHRWSGQVEEPADYVAFMGKDPGCEQVYVITGDSGMGMTHCTIGGKLVSDMILGVPNPCVELYDPKRLKLKALPEMASHLAQVNMQYRDYFKGGDIEDIESLASGNGGIYCKGINRYAVYKDHNGQVHACKATCPHMKGQVRWNSLEKSFDCPVHGSRFDRYGEAIHGPAKTALTHVSLEEIKKE